MFLTFLIKPNAPLFIIRTAHEPGIIMILPLIFLSIASIFIGYISKDMIIGIGSIY